MTGTLSDDLKEMGYEPTDRESPFSETGRLWTNGVELVCDDTAIVIDGTYSPSENGTSKDVVRYPNSERVRMIGGFFGPYFEGDGLYGEH